MVNAVPDWLEQPFARLVDIAKQNRLPHGLLVIGRPGDGSAHFTQYLADYLLCQNPGQRACGECKACQLALSGNHPDFLKVEPEGKSQTIKVDAVRSVIESLSETAQQGACKVVYFTSAQTMNVNAANALLKVLEEPTANTFILLETEELSSTLPTIRSRCRIIQLPRPSQTQALNYLKQHQYEGDASLALGMSSWAPLSALQVTPADIDAWLEVEAQFLSSQSFIQLSQYIAKQEAPKLFAQMLFWVDDAIRRQKGQSGLAPVSVRLVQSLDSVPLVTLFHFRDYIIEILGAFRRQANLNAQLLAEQLASKWIQLRGYQ